MTESAQIPYPDEHPQRLGVLTELPTLLAELGVEPEGLLREHGLTPAEFEDPDGSLPYLTLSDVVDHAAEETGRPDFGLRLGLKGTVAHLGLIGLLMRTAPTIKQAMNDLVENHHRIVRGAVPYVLEDGSESLFAYRALVGRPATVQAGLIAVGFIYRFFNELGSVRPDQLLFACRPLNGSLEAFAGSRIVFDATQYAAAYSPDQLARPIAVPPRLHRAAALQYVAHHERHMKPDLADSARRAVTMLLHKGDLSVAAVARKLRLNRRTLNRRLMESGVTARQLINEVRYEIALQLLDATDLSVSDVAAAVGYEEVSSFSRWFRSCGGKPPSRWRSSSN